MVDFRIRETEGSDPQPELAWDTRWDEQNQVLSWRIESRSNLLNPGGLQANRALDTAIMLQLATWKRADPSMHLPAGEDPQGWWGDTIDVEDGEAELGSWLWVLYRSVLNEDTRQLAITYAYDCLEPIRKQGAVVRFDVTADMDQVQGYLAPDHQGLQPDRRSHLRAKKFSRLWQQEFVAQGTRL